MRRASRICLCLGAETIEADLRHVAANRDRIDMVELRVDRLLPGERPAAARFPKLVDLPAVLTVRVPRDGGRFDGDERERVALIERLCDGFAYVDLEETLRAPALEERIRAGGGRIIRSFHDLEAVPRGLPDRVAGLARRGDEIPKAAVTPRTSSDLVPVLEAVKRLGDREKVLLAMGDVGFPTRVLAPRLGCSWCYTSPGSEPVAPGQVDPWTLAGLYRFRATGPGTAVYGVVGNPVMHSRSPLIHNRGYDALGIDAVYVPFLVPDLDDFWPLADALGVRGLSITVPHKETAARSISAGDDLVAAVGACNTVVRADRGWRGTNTDIAGFMAPLRRAVGEVRGLGATVIGAGGAARSVVHALVTAGARVLVLNRGPDRAARLAREMGVECAGLDGAGCRRAADFADLIVQTTSVGMAAQPGDPAPGLALTGRELVYELIYAPAETPFLARARAAGCRTIRGKSMLIAQAMEQFRLFTGKAYPAELAAELETSID